MPRMSVNFSGAVSERQSFLEIEGLGSRFRAERKEGDDQPKRTRHRQEYS